jgi:hypothetical protein
MPTIALKSKVRTASEHCSLSLNIRHRLLLDQPSDTVFDMKPTIPENVDVLLFSNLLITVSGALDGARITPAELKASYIAKHLLDCLQRVFIAQPMGHSYTEFDRLEFGGTRNKCSV